MKAFPLPLLLELFFALFGPFVPLLPFFDPFPDFLDLLVFLEPFPVGASVAVPVTERLSSPIAVGNEEGAADTDSDTDSDADPETDPDPDPETDPGVPVAVVVAVPVPVWADACPAKSTNA